VTCFDSELEQLE